MKNKITKHFQIHKIPISFKTIILILMSITQNHIQNYIIVFFIPINLYKNILLFYLNIAFFIFASFKQYYCSISLLFSSPNVAYKTLFFERFPNLSISFKPNIPIQDQLRNKDISEELIVKNFRKNHDKKHHMLEENLK